MANVDVETKEKKVEFIVTAQGKSKDHMAISPCDIPRLHPQTELSTFALRT